MSLRATFEDRPLLLGILVSFVWHFFWFFSVTITVGPDGSWSRKTESRSVSLGPVLDDTIFKTLIENRPQITETFYRHMSDFAPAPPEPENPTLERATPGGVVSVPFGKKFITSLKEFVDGDKPFADFDLGPSSDASTGFSETLEGDIRKRSLLSRPVRPELPIEIQAISRDVEAVIGITVAPSGDIVQIGLIASSGNASLDKLWLEYVRGFRFDTARAQQAGKIRLKSR